MLGDVAHALDGLDDLGREIGSHTQVRVQVVRATPGAATAASPTHHARVAAHIVEGEVARESRAVPAPVGVSDLHAVAGSHDDLGRAVAVDVRPSHYEQPGQDVEEDLTHPGRHGVRGGRPEVDVEHDDGDDNGEGDEYHGEE